jgi:hypothetical protein
MTRRKSHRVLVVAVALRPEIESFNVKSFRAAILHVPVGKSACIHQQKQKLHLPSKCIFSGKVSAAVVASVIPLFHVHTLIVPL